MLASSCPTCRRSCRGEVSERRLAASSFAVLPPAVLDSVTVVASCGHRVDSLSPPAGVCLFAIGTARAAAPAVAGSTGGAGGAAVAGSAGGTHAAGGAADAGGAGGAHAAGGAPAPADRTVVKLTMLDFDDGIFSGRARGDQRVVFASPAPDCAHCTRAREKGRVAPGRAHQTALAASPRLNFATAAASRPRATPRASARARRQCRHATRRGTRKVRARRARG